MDTKEFDENIDVTNVEDWLVRLILKDQVVLQHEGEWPCDHKIGHSNLLDRVGKSKIKDATTSMVEEDSMIEYESKEMEG